MLDTYVDLRQLGRSPGDRDDGDGIRTNRNVCNLRQQRPAIVTLTSSDAARRQPSTAGNVASDPRRQLAAEESIATEAGAERFTIVAWRHTNPSASSACLSAKTRNTHSAVEARVADGLDAENVGARGISRVQRTALWWLRPRPARRPPTTVRGESAALQKQTEIA